MLTAATYLGDNTIAPLRELTEHLRSRGMPTTLVNLDARSSVDARRDAPTVDLVWMCGALTATLLHRGELTHRVIAAPIFEGEPNASYRSVVVARPDGPSTLADALAGRVAINELDSWSGHHVLRRELGDTWFASEVLSGSHQRSLDMVMNRNATCAAIDSTIWHAAGADYHGSLRVISETARWPAPPLLLSSSVDPAVAENVVDCILEIAELSGVQGFIPSTGTPYEKMVV